MFHVIRMLTCCSISWDSNAVLPRASMTGLPKTSLWVDLPFMMIMMVSPANTNGKSLYPNDYASIRLTWSWYIFSTLECSSPYGMGGNAEPHTFFSVSHSVFLLSHELSVFKFLLTSLPSYPYSTLRRPPSTRLRKRATYIVGSFICFHILGLNLQIYTTGRVSRFR